MRILVTGGAGFIGSNFIRVLLGDSTSRVERIVNLDKLTYAGGLGNCHGLEQDPRYRFVRGDIGDLALVSELLAAERIQAVVNFAAESHVDRSIDSPEPFVQANVVGSFRLLEAARRHYRSLEAAAASAFRFLHVSTDEVYGSLSPEDPAFSENTRYAPNSPYSASKAASDHFARAYHHTYGLPVLTTNCSNNYGPYQFPEKLIPLMILNAVEGKPLPIYGDGRNVRDWLYVEDHCSAIRRVLASGRIGEVYNVGGLTEKTNLEMVDLICSLLDELLPRPDGRSYREQKTFVADRPGHDRRYAIDCSKIQTELGWNPAETLATGLRKTVQWYLDNAAWRDEIAASKYQRERLGKGT
jgi:dTDP-glucose 4,6-dehydratase